MDEPNLKVVRSNNIQYGIEIKKKVSNDEKYEKYAFCPRFGRNIIWDHLTKLAEQEKLFYYDYGIKVNYEVTGGGNKPTLIKKPKQENCWGYKNQLPELMKLDVKTRYANALKESPLYKIVDRLFINFTFSKAAFQSKKFAETDEVYNFFRYTMYGYGKKRIGSFSFTVMEDSTINNDRILLFPWAGNHLR